MKVVCTNLGEQLDYFTNRENITIGKSYEVISKISGYDLLNSKDGGVIGDYVTIYDIFNDIGEKVSYNSKLFLTVEEWREKRLNDLNI